MIYLHARKNAIFEKKKRKIVIIFLILLVLALLSIPRASRRVIGSIVQTIAKPIQSAGGGISNFFQNRSYVFNSKKSLMQENFILSEQVAKLSAENIDRTTLLEENIKLKDAFSRQKISTSILGVILQKPPAILYDTLTIDIGSAEGVIVGEKVFAYGNIFIGRIDEIYKHTSKVKLLSAYNEKTNIVLGNQDAYFDMMGRGGENFEIVVPRDIDIKIGDNAIYPDIAPFVVAVVSNIIIDDRDPFKKIILKNPVNINELKFVEVEKVSQ